MPAPVEVVPGDLADEPSLRAALAGVQVVIHAAASVGEGRSEADLMRTNAEGTGRLARVALRCGVPRFIHLSSAAVYGDEAVAKRHGEDDPLNARSPYQRSKLAAEVALAQALAQAHGSATMHWTILRPAGLYGPDRPQTQAFFREVARRKVWLHAAAPAVLQPTHVDDLVQAVDLALRHEGSRGEAINVGGSRALTYPELIALVAARVGARPLQLHAPRWARRVAAGAARIRPGWGAAAPLVRLGREGPNSAVDIGKARRLLGFEPMPLEAGLDRTVAEMRAAGMLPS